MRIATCAVGLCGAVLAACASAGGVPVEFTEALATAPAATSARVVVDGAALRELGAPIALGALPPAVARMARSVQPGGEPAAARVFGDDGTAYRVTTSYGDAGHPERRTVLLDAEGAILERSHAIPLHEVEPRTRSRIATLGEICAAEVVQREPGEEIYRFFLAQPSGETFVAQCDLDGSDLRLARVVPAEIWAWQAEAEMR